MCRQETCDDDDDFTVGWKDELPPGVQGCLRPQKPPNSFLRVTDATCRYMLVPHVARSALMEKLIHDNVPNIRF